MSEFEAEYKKKTFWQVIRLKDGMYRALECTRSSYDTDWDIEILCDSRSEEFLLNILIPQRKRDLEYTAKDWADEYFAPAEHSDYLFGLKKSLIPFKNGKIPKTRGSGNEADHY